MREKTDAIHYGYEKDSQKTMTVPIYQTTAYEFDSTQYASELFDLERVGNIYTRLSNPTTDVFEKRFAKLENGVSALATASGTSAIFYTIANVAEAGDNIVVANQVYGGTTTLTSHTIKRFGIEARYFNVMDLESLKELIDEKTKLILCESITNPSIDVADISQIAKIADEVGVLFCVDNTVASPAICKPLDFGADLVVHSTSKYTTGQGLAIGGVMVESASAKKKIKNNPRYYHFNEPDQSYHGLIYTELEFPPFTLRARLSLLRDFGAVPSPFNSWLFINGLETLALRMRQHSDSALEIAKFLETHPKVKRVNYPALKSSPHYHLSQKYFKNGMTSGLLSFELESKEIAQKVADATEIFKIVANIGDSKSIITHPASTTHQQLSKEELILAGVPEGLIRLSVGLEDTQDLIEDLDRAIKKAL
jgi:O-acetylhomoserine (thiol)-lyase